MSDGGGASSALQSLMSAQGGTSGCQSAGMQAWLNGHLCYMLPMQMRVSTGLEQIGGFKGLNSPVFQLANQLMNSGHSFGLGAIWAELKQMLNGNLTDHAADLQDAFAALAQAKYDEGFSASHSSLMNLRIQSLPDNHIGSDGHGIG